MTFTRQLTKPAPVVREKFYQKNWPVILKAFALWMEQEKMFESARLNLILGLTIETICDLVSRQTTDTVFICLEAFCSCLTSSTDNSAKSAFVKDIRLPTELLYALHRFSFLLVFLIYLLLIFLSFSRVFLTREDIRVH